MFHKKRYFSTILNNSDVVLNFRYIHIIYKDWVEQLILVNHISKCSSIWQENVTYIRISKCKQWWLTIPPISNINKTIISQSSAHTRKNTWHMALEFQVLASVLPLKIQLVRGLGSCWSCYFYEGRCFEQIKVSN